MNDWIDCCIMAYPHIEWNDEKKGDFKVATLFGDIPLICFHTIPHYAFKHIERNIEYVLEHETIAFTLEVIYKGLHIKFDSLFPFIEDMRTLTQQK